MVREKNYVVCKIFIKLGNLYNIVYCLCFYKYIFILIIEVNGIFVFKDDYIYML